MENYDSLDTLDKKLDYLYDFVFDAENRIEAMDRILEFFETREIDPNELKTIKMMMRNIQDESIQSKLKKLTTKNKLK